MSIDVDPARQEQQYGAQSCNKKGPKSLVLKAHLCLENENRTGHMSSTCNSAAYWQRRPPGKANAPQWFQGKRTRAEAEYGCHNGFGSLN